MPALAETIRPSRPPDTQEAERHATLEKDRLFRIRYLIANSYGVGHDELTSSPSSVRSALARSLAIAVARDILCTDLGALAGHFGCSGPTEVAEHCNRIARRSDNDHRFAAAMTFAKASCAVALGLDV